LQNVFIIDNVDCHCDDGDNTSPGFTIYDVPELRPNVWPENDPGVDDDDLVDYGGTMVACCLPNGGCGLLTLEACEIAGGTARTGETCDPSQCSPVPTEKRDWSEIKSWYK